MRRTLTSLFVLGFYFMNYAQSQTNTVNAITVSNPAPISEAEIPVDLTTITASLSEGFTDSSFQSVLQLSISDDHQLSMDTEYLHTLQYTISNIEGIILRKGKFYASGTVDLSTYRDGSYAIYFFAGKRIVRALMLERKHTAM